MSGLEAVVTAAAATLVGLVVTGLYRALARAFRRVAGHLAALARLPDALDQLRDALGIFDARITRLERHLGVHP